MSKEGPQLSRTFQKIEKLSRMEEQKNLKQLLLNLSEQIHGYMKLAK